MATVRSFEHVSGNIVIRDKNGKAMFCGRVREASMTESRDMAAGQIDFDITVEDGFTFALKQLRQPEVKSNAQIWAEIDALEQSRRDRDITHAQFISGRRSLMAQLQGPINRPALERMQGESVSLVAYDESSELKNYQAAKNAMFAAAYGAPDHVMRALLQWRKARRPLQFSKHASYVGGFEEDMPSGFHRVTRCFDLEESW